MAACTSNGPSSYDVSLPPAARLTATPPPVSTGAEGRLVVVGLDGNLSTMRSDGTDRLALTTDAGPGVQFTQPTWSPDGRRIA